MKKWKNEQMNKWTNEQMKKWKNEKMKKWTNEQMKKLKNEKNDLIVIIWFTSSITEKIRIFEYLNENLFFEIKQI